MLSSSISSEVAWAAMMPWRAAALMAMTFCMTGSRGLRFGALLGGLIASERFGMSACQGENGFKRKRIVSSRPWRRNIRARNGSNFNARKIGYDRRVLPDLARLRERSDSRNGAKPGEGDSL